ncbi:hypothetical protein IQE94_02865 [Synechocystis sp. PCC 7339]|uniref:hypothetical protein n=1 Tax=unclassified Synechocystis TaxID=2640012 RepID=UPI001BAEDC1A|nr:MULTISPECIES: hypothetical protein [unclassified Synechocystis]QUS61108.1 hypothetical protein HTZ78_10800 [Synechocystis sp. PCC 7338]UAJ73291.1 hypothetical protein IQE94_02865 [Synechocystis sp. PCC 7339]
MGRAHYQAGFSISPLAIAVNVNLVRQRANAPSPQPWQWIYTFSDGSQLQGTFQGAVKPGPEFANPIPSFDVQGVGVTEYLTAADKTPLLAWQPGQFNCFEMGESLLLMASSDNYVGNSLCLVNCPQRQWAQITHWGSRLVAEPLLWERLAFHCLARDMPPTAWSMNWQFSPFLPPFFHWRFQAWPPTAIANPLTCPSNNSSVLLS